MKRQFKHLIASCLATWLLIQATAHAQQTNSPQQPPRLQQQISSKFNQFKNSVSEKFSRRLPSYRTTDYLADRSLRNPPAAQPQPVHRPIPQNRQVSSQQNTHQHPNNGVAYAVGYTQEPQSDFQAYNSDQGYQQPVESRQSQEFQPNPNARQLRNTTDHSDQLSPQNNLRQPRPIQGQPMQYQPMQNQQWQPALQPDPRDRMATQRPSNYQNFLQSDAKISPKPRSMDYYNQTRFRHFSNRISGTERAIILEDELAKIREEKNELAAKNKLLEDQVTQRNDEIARLQTAIDDAMQQLSKAAEAQNRLQESIKTVENLRNSEKEASEQLLDELRKQLNNLLANELIGANESQ